jgi:NADPH-dependent F420 reductase
MSTSHLPTVAVLGGTGALGKGLAVRWARAGVPVVIGSRSADRAEAAAASITDVEHLLRGLDLVDAASAADVVVIAVPWEAHRDTLEQVAHAVTGKLVIDAVNPLGFDKRGAYALPVAEGSAAQQAQALLPDAHVVAAFHHVSAVVLGDEAVAKVDLDVLVLGDDRESTDRAQELVGLIPGMRGVYGGGLRNAAQVEGLTANLISINRRYKSHAGIAVTGLSL